MKNLKEMLDSAVEPIKLGAKSMFSNFLTEESDYIGNNLLTEEDDPFAAANDAGADANNDAGADPFGAAGNDAGADPFGAAGDAGADAGGAADANNPQNSGTDGDDADDDPDVNPALTDDSHEDDPEFNQGVGDSKDVTLSDTPAAKSIYDIEKIMQTITTVIQTLSEEQLVEIEKVKNAIELIFNGKILNEEDLEFNNIKNAIFLIKKIGAKLDIKAKAYLNRKLKEPLIKKRDQIKQNIAAQKGDLEATRDVLTALDIQ